MPELVARRRPRDKSCCWAIPPTEAFCDKRMAWPEAPACAATLYRRAGRELTTKEVRQLGVVHGKPVPSGYFVLEQSTIGPAHTVSVVRSPDEPGKRMLCIGGVVYRGILHDFTPSEPQGNTSFRSGFCSYPGELQGWSVRDLLQHHGHAWGRHAAAFALKDGGDLRRALDPEDFGATVGWRSEGPLIKAPLDQLRRQMPYVLQVLRRRGGCPTSNLFSKIRNGLKRPLAHELKNGRLRFFGAPHCLSQQLHGEGYCFDQWIADPEPKPATLSAWHMGLEGIATIHALCTLGYSPSGDPSGDADVLVAIDMFFSAGELLPLIEGWIKARPGDPWVSRLKKTACRQIRNNKQNFALAKKAVANWAQGHPNEDLLQPLWDRINTVDDWPEMKQFIQRQADFAMHECARGSASEMGHKIARDRLWESVSGAATATVPTFLGGESMETRIHILVELATRAKGGPKILKIVEAIDSMEAMTFANLEDAGCKARDLLIERLKKLRGPARETLIKHVQPSREGWKDRIFELQQMSSQFLSVPAVKHLQRLVKKSAVMINKIARFCAGRYVTEGYEVAKLIHDSLTHIDEEIMKPCDVYSKKPGGTELTRELLATVHETGGSGTRSSRVEFAQAPPSAEKGGNGTWTAERQTWTDCQRDVAPGDLSAPFPLAAGLGEQIAAAINAGSSG
ncbi:unnamed protein product, partial [Prorocentrum cordatum]